MSALRSDRPRGPLDALLDSGARLDSRDPRPLEAAERCRAALAEAGVPLARWLELPGVARREATLELAPVWAALELAERSDGAGLDRLAALTVEGSGDGALLARALELPLGRGRLPRAVLTAALQARRDETRLGHWATRRELAGHLGRRGRALPRLWLGLAGGSTERREVLLTKGVLAAELARALGSFASGVAAGRLPLSSEDLERTGASAAQLLRSPTPEPLRRALAEQAVWAREQLAVAWALPQDLGWRHAAWAGAWLRGVETRLRALEAVDFDLNSGDVEPSAARSSLSMVAGALWWLPPRSVARHLGGLDG